MLLPDQEGESPPVILSYRELDARARRLAGWLQLRGATGKRVLIVQSDRGLFAVCFLACLYAGAVAVPVAPLPGNGRHHEARVAGIARDAAPALALADAAGAPDVSRLLAGCGQGHIDCVAADMVQDAGWSAPRLTGDSPALLQYTSGSTREPYGVVVTHRNLLANQRAMRRALGTGPDARFGGWLPFHHDMGLVGTLLHPLWLGATSVLLSPEAFARRPLRWLEMISEHRVTVSGAPDFAYHLCGVAGQEPPPGLDLSHWRTAVSGGEPVRARTWSAFRARFAAAGFRPAALTAAYGLAEATLLVSGGPPAPPLAVDTEALERHLLTPAAPDRPTIVLQSSGAPAGAEVRIVDPTTHAARAEGEVGEIWVRGDSVCQGYWQRPGETLRTFGARTAEGRAGYLRTGDLGALRDGLLYVTGRLKETMVTSGRNLYPHDLEQTVQQLSELFGSASAFSVDTAERERIVVVQEVRIRSRYRVDWPRLVSAVEHCLSLEFGVEAGAVLLVPPGSVRRTTSGKVERGAMRRMFLRGELRPLHQVIAPELRALLAEATG